MSRIETQRGSAGRRRPAVPCEPAVDPADWTGEELARATDWVFELATPGGRPIPDAILERYVGLAPGQRPSGIVVEATKLCAPLTPE